jgi:hypothetical protein
MINRDHLAQTRNQRASTVLGPIYDTNYKQTPGVILREPIRSRQFNLSGIQSMSSYSGEP